MASAQKSTASYADQHYKTWRVQDMLHQFLNAEIMPDKTRGTRDGLAQQLTEHEIAYDPNFRSPTHMKNLSVANLPQKIEFRVKKRTNEEAKAAEGGAEQAEAEAGLFEAENEDDDDDEENTRKKSRPNPDPPAPTPPNPPNGTATGNDGGGGSGGDSSNPTNGTATSNDSGGGSGGDSSNPPNGTATGNDSGGGGGDSSNPPNGTATGNDSGGGGGDSSNPTNGTATGNDAGGTGGSDPAAIQNKPSPPAQNPSPPIVLTPEILQSPVFRLFRALVQKHLEERRVVDQQFKNATPEARKQAVISVTEKQSLEYVTMRIDHPTDDQWNLIRNSNDRNSEEELFKALMEEQEKDRQKLSEKEISEDDKARELKELEERHQKQVGIMGLTQLAQRRQDGGGGSTHEQQTGGDSGPSQGSNNTSSNPLDAQAEEEWDSSTVDGNSDLPNLPIRSDDPNLPPRPNRLKLFRALTGRHEEQRKWLLKVLDSNGETPEARAPRIKELEDVHRQEIRQMSLEHPKLQQLAAHDDNPCSEQELLRALMEEQERERQIFAADMVERPPTSEDRALWFRRLEALHQKQIKIMGLEHLSSKRGPLERIIETQRKPREQDGNSVMIDDPDEDVETKKEGYAIGFHPNSKNLLAVMLPSRNSEFPHLRRIVFTWDADAIKKYKEKGSKETLERGTADDLLLGRDRITGIKNYAKPLDFELFGVGSYPWGARLHHFAIGDPEGHGRLLVFSKSVLQATWKKRDALGFLDQRAKDVGQNIHLDMALCNHIRPRAFLQ